MKKILVVDGPNLNLLGVREPEIYGTLTYSELKSIVVAEADELGFQVDHRQTNHEGAIIDYLQETEFDGILLNPGAYTHSSMAIADALAALSIPVIEVHLTNIHTRYSRNRSVTAAQCNGIIAGFGLEGYIMGLQQLARLIG